METYLTLDIGGSAIKYAQVNKAGEILEKGKVPTPLDTLNNLIASIQQIHTNYNTVKGIAISMPGVIDMEKGIAYTGGVLTYIRNIPFASLVQEACHVPVTIGNDAKCAGYAEVGFGALKDVNNAVVLIFGTAIGGCVIIDKKVFQGVHFAAGELSNIRTNSDEPYNPMQCWWAKNGIKGLLSRVQNATHSKEEYTGEEIFSKANAGDEAVIAGIDRFCQDIALQIFNIQVLLDVERIAVGGGISAQPLLMELINKNLDKVFAFGDHPVHRPEVVACKYRNDANLLGAFYQHELYINKK